MFANDEYTLEIDILGYKQQADNIRKLITQSDTPYAIGISGRWGSGKSSLMRYIMASLGGKPLIHRLKYQTDFLKNSKEEQKFKTIFSLEEYKDLVDVQTIWFNPWEHENHEEPIVELLREIRRHFELLSTIKAEAKKLSAVSVQAGLDMLGAFLKVGSNQATNICKTGDMYEHENFSYETRNQRFKLIFEKAIEKLLTRPGHTFPSDRARLVIFIDDLDRCEAETVSLLLREIKQYLSSKRCVFVFGYDRHHVERVLSDTTKRTVKETRCYFEKLFQTTIYIKQPSEMRIRQYIYSKLTSGEYGFISAHNQEKLVEFISKVIDPNPRRIKSFITSLYFHVKSSSFNSSADIPLEDLKKLALIAYLKMFYESVYTVLENKPELLSNLINVFKNRNRLSSSNYTEFFLYLELRSHINDLDIELDKSLIEKEFKNDQSSERKILDEVYEMQGRHKSFECYMAEFVFQFQAMASGNQGAINDYL